jgi:hypothetical protein
MDLFETSTTVGPTGDIRVVGSPFRPGETVNVGVSSQRSTPANFEAEWSRVCAELRRQAPAVNDQEIQNEIQDLRRGK